MLTPTHPVPTDHLPTLPVELPDCPNILTSWPEAEGCCPRYARVLFTYDPNGCKCSCHFAGPGSAVGEEEL